MASLGTFAAALREYEAKAEPDTFEFAGETFTVHAEIPAILELTITAALAGKATGQDGDAAMYEALRIALTVPEREVDGKKIPADGEQWQRFVQLATARRVAAEDLSLLALAVAGFQVGRPTGQRSTSSPGSLPTSTSSNTSASDSPASPDSASDDAASAG